MTDYVAITPARDEEQYLPGLISSLLSQDIHPQLWIVLDDGSSDRTAEILDRAAGDHRWIEVHHLPRNRPRAAGAETIVRQFLPREVWSRHDFVLRLDADLTFGKDLARLLIREFSRDSRLGIAGATLLEPCANGWQELRQPAFHTHGAVKMYSRACFAGIGGLKAGLGWDTIDEACAMMQGFRTRHFRHVRAYHHRPQGRAGGRWTGRINAGRAAYEAGYSPLFMLARAAIKTIQPPLSANGIAMLAGFLEGYLERRPRAASPELMKFVREQQVRRLLLKESLWR